MLLKCFTQYASKFGKLSSGHRTGKGKFSFKSQRKAMSKNAQTTAQLHSSHTLANAQNSLFRLQQYVNFQMFKLDLQKAEKPEIKLPTFAGSSKKLREFQRNIYFCFLDYAKVFNCVDHNNLWKILQEM